MENADLDSSLARRICQGENPWSADGIISYSRMDSTVSINLFNADGSLAGFSGNGFACVAYHLMSMGNADCLTLNSAQVSVEVNCREEGVELYLPGFQPDLKAKYPFEYRVGGLVYETIDVGNEHAVFFDTVESPAVESYFADRSLFPESININLAKVINRQEIELEVIERGCGRTPACTSGAFATVITAVLAGFCEPPVIVRQVGGEVLIDRDAEGRYSVVLQPKKVGTYKYGSER